MVKPIPRKSEASLFEVVLTGNLEISPDVYLLSYARPYNFEPGQVVKIGIDHKNPPRIYSICSGNKENEISILYNIKEDGFLTPKLATLIPGDTILVSKPYGSFLGSKDKAWWIATGTGIAPFYSMLKSGLTTNKTLIHGVRRVNQFYFEDELEEILGDNYVRCCSQEQACNVLPGRVSEYLKGITELPKVKYYICGQASMVVEVRDILIEKGILYDNILAEIYF